MSGDMLDTMTLAQARAEVLRLRAKVQRLSAAAAKGARRKCIRCEREAEFCHGHASNGLQQGAALAEYKARLKHLLAKGPRMGLDAPDEWHATLTPGANWRNWKVKP